MSDFSRSGRQRRVIFLLLGLIILGAILWSADITAIADHLGSAGWGIIAILFVYLVAFLADTASWQLVLPGCQLNFGWFYALWKVRMVGAALNRVTPVVGLAGEPVKAFLLRKYYSIDYREGIASLIAAKTANLIGLVVFLATGLAIALAHSLLPAGHWWGSLGVLAALAMGVVALVAVQRLKLSSAIGSWLSRRAFGRRVASIIHHIRDLDELLVNYYTRHRGRFGVAILLTFGNWVMGALELWLTLWVIGHPITFIQAWYADAAVELVRAATFFIPASIGTQEAALLFVLGPITGQPSLGLAVAVIRRFREILWIGWGFSIGWISFDYTPKIMTKNE